MDFTIRKDSTFPIIKMTLNRSSFTNSQKFHEMLENAAVTFSMIDAHTGKYKIANRAGGVHPIECANCVYQEYVIYYKWTERDVNKVGTYKAEFKIDFFNTEGDGCGSLIVPRQDDLYVHIIDSFVKTEKVS